MIIMNLIQPLQLDVIFENYLAGSAEIFFFLIMIVLVYLAARFKMPNQITLILMALFVIIMAPWFPLFYGFIILIIGLLFYFVLSKMIKS